MESQGFKGGIKGFQEVKTQWGRQGRVGGPMGSKGTSGVLGGHEGSLGGPRT